jgi:hypothetical protein
MKTNPEFGTTIRIRREVLDTPSAANPIGIETPGLLPGRN